MIRRPRVVVCGTKFGQVYLQAFQDPSIPFELAGILARGSERSRAVARHYQVPMFTGVDELPADIDIACVVVRSGLLGGQGVELARALMQRGVNVLQEHPLHGDELAVCLRDASQSGAVHSLTTFYPYQRPVRQFVAAVRSLLGRQCPRYIDAACGFQLVFALFDILGRALGAVRPWGFADLTALPDRVSMLIADGLDVPFRSLDGVFAGVPMTLRVQNQMDPADPDNYAHLMHRITIGTEGGALTLIATHGPTVWNPRPDFPRTVRESDVRPHFGPPSGRHHDHPDLPSTAIIGEAESPGYHKIFESIWPDGVRRALAETWELVQAHRRPVARNQYYLTLCELWQDVMTRLGPPQLVHGGVVEPIGRDAFDSLVNAATEAGR